MRKLFFGLFVVLVLGSIGLFFWARAVFTQDTFRAALAGELSKALGQPVSIGTISATIYPRVTLTLGNVVIGNPVGVQISSMKLGTDFGALLSRRIEHATARVEGAKVQLPLLPLGHATSAAEAPDSSEATRAPVQLVSIDEIVLSDVDLISAGRTLHGHIEVIPEPGRALTLRRASLTAEDVSVEATGRITDLRGPTGELTLTAGELNIDRLVAFFNDFADGTGASTSEEPAPRTSDTVKLDLNVAIDATRATLADLTLDGLTGRAHFMDAGWNATFKATRAAQGDLTIENISGRAEVTGTGRIITFNATRAKMADLMLDNLSGRADLTGTDRNVTFTATDGRFASLAVGGVSGHAHMTDTHVLLKPVAFGVFGGRYDGSLGFQPARAGAAPAFNVSGALSSIDVVTMTRLAGAKTDPITGRLAAQLELAGTGRDTGAVMRSMHGTARVKIVDGIVRNLGLLRAVVVGTSMRGGTATLEGASAAASAEAAKTRDEPFKTLTATLAVAGARATTRDLRFEGTDVSLSARGVIALDGSDVTLAGQVQLSKALTAKAGSDLVRYTRQNGRVTLPLTITGPVSAMSVQIDVGEAVNRAIRNRVEEELQKAIIKGLGGLIKKPPK